MARTSGIACLVLGSMLLTAYVALYLRKQRSRMGRNNGAGGVGKEGDANNNQMVIIVSVLNIIVHLL